MIVLRWVSFINGMTDGSVRSVAEGLIAGSPVEEVPRRQIFKVISFLEAQKAAIIQNGDYLTAQIFEDKINELKLLSTQDAFVGMQLDRHSELEDRLAEARRELAERRQARDRVIKTFQENRERSLRDFDEWADKKLAEFDCQHNCDPPAKFRKYSYEYLNLRMKEKYMISSKRFIEANALMEEADEREKIELANQQRNWEQFTATQRQLLLHHHREQRRILEEKWECDWAALAPSGIAEIAKCVNAIRAIEAQLVIVDGEPNVAFDGTATRASSQMTTARDSTSRATNRQLLPRLDVSPKQPNKLRSRMTYMRAKNYGESQKRKIYKRLKNGSP